MYLQRKKARVICYLVLSVIWLVSNTGWLASAWSRILWRMLGVSSNTANAALSTEYRLLKCRTCLEKWDTVSGVTHLDNIMYVVIIFISVNDQSHEATVNWVIQVHAAVTDAAPPTGHVSAASSSMSVRYNDRQLRHEVWLPQYMNKLYCGVKTTHGMFV